MTAFPALNFGQSGKSLFSPQEIARLMEAEFRRSQRYGYPLGLCLVGIDRLESLHDLYGVDSRERIVEAVLALLRSTTRASDALGTLREQRLLVLLPHSPRPACQAVARRLLRGCRELEFRGDGRNLRASLSIGLVQRTGEASLATLAARAEQALAAALEAGGNRFVEAEELLPPPTPVRLVPPELPRAVAPVAGPPPAAPLPPLPAPEELGGGDLAERIHRLFQVVGGGDGLLALERDVLTTLQRTLDDARPRPRSSADVQAAIVTLEARVAELRRMLDASEQELERMVREKSVDPGLASLYHGVQGLDPGTKDFAKKKELLAVIYQANVELLRELKAEGRGG